MLLVLGRIINGQINDNNSPAIIRHEEVEVFGSSILVAVAEEGAYFSPRHVCEGVGVGWNNQHKKILFSDDLSACMVKASIMVPGDTQSRKFLMLPIEKLSGWLFMINPNMVKPSIKPKLLKYRAEAFAVLDAWFRKNARAAEDPTDMRRLILQTIQEQEQRAEERLQKALAPVMVQIEALGIENKTMKPKVEAYDAITDRGQTFLLSNVAREVGVPRSILTRLLFEGGVVEPRKFGNQMRFIPTDYAKSANLTTDYYNAQGFKQIATYYLTAKGRSLCERLAFDWKAQQEGKAA